MTPISVIITVLLGSLSVFALQPQTSEVNSLVYCESDSARTAPSAVELVSGKLNLALNNPAGVTVSTVVNRVGFPLATARFFNIKPPFTISNSTVTVTVQDTLTYIASICVTLTK